MANKKESGGYQVLEKSEKCTADVKRCVDFA